MSTFGGQCSRQGTRSCTARAREVVPSTVPADAGDVHPQADGVCGLEPSPRWTAVPPADISRPLLQSSADGAKNLTSATMKVEQRIDGPAVEAYTVSGSQTRSEEERMGLRNTVDGCFIRPRAGRGQYPVKPLACLRELPSGSRACSAADGAYSLGRSTPEKKPEGGKS